MKLRLLFSGLAPATPEFRGRSDCHSAASLVNRMVTRMPSSLTDAQQVSRHISINQQIFRALLSIASATLLIRVVGMGNQVVVTSHFGAGADMDAYTVASALPLLLGQLISSGIEGAVIPVYTRERVNRNHEETSVLFSTLLNICTLGAALLTLIAFIFRRQLLWLVAPALDPSRMELTLSLAPFIFPALLLTIVIGFLEGILNSEGQFGWPAYAGMLVPLSTAVWVLVTAKSLGVTAMCIGVVTGMCLQLATFTVRTRRARIIYRPIIDVHHPALRTILIAACPLLLTGVVELAPNLTDQIFASFLPAGSISALSYASKLISVPVGVIFASIGQAAFPYLSRQAASDDIAGIKGTLQTYLWPLGIGTIVMTVAMVVLAHPLVRILFQRGAFDAAQTDLTATTLIGFALGLTPMAYGFILSKVFPAIGRPRMILYFSTFMVVANVVFDYIFARLWQNFGIALATSAVYYCTMLVLLFALRRAIGPLDLFTPPPWLRSWWRGE